MVEWGGLEEPGRRLPGGTSSDSTSTESVSADVVSGSVALQGKVYMRPASFPGDELRRVRESQGLTLVDVFRKTRIPMAYLSAIEEGDARALPALCYAVGFVKTYCEFLKVEPERYCDSLRGCMAPVVRRFLRTQVVQDKVWQGRFRSAMTWAAVCAVIALAWLTYAVVVRPNASLAERQVKAEQAEIVVPPAPPEIQF